MSLIHNITQEGHPFQKRTLYVLARWLELPFLFISYRLLRGRWQWLGKRRWFMRLYGTLITRPIATLGDSARPIPYDALMRHIDAVNSEIAVGACRCRITNHACSHPLETDIVIRTGTGAWLRAFPRDYRIIDRDEAKRIVTLCHEAGMFHMLFHHCPSTGCAEYVICNCCRCGCTIHIINRDMGDKCFPLLKGDWHEYTDMKLCTNHGDCIAVCPQGARSMRDGRLAVEGCIGCGLCVAVCPERAVSMAEDKEHGLKGGMIFKTG